MGRQLRKHIFSIDEVSIVHCVQRCVRRAFLAGSDKDSGNDYSYRREWIRRRMEVLASVFAIDVLTYSILSNHYHIVLRNRPDVLSELTDEEVAIRWLKIFPGRRMSEDVGSPTCDDVEALMNCEGRISQIRKRLCDISWFMKCLSESIARAANRQDDVTGRFWQGRFKAQRITDEAGLLAISMYVDLNPIRAALADTLEDARHTSAYDRIQGARGETIESAAFSSEPVESELAGAIIQSASPEEMVDRRRVTKRRSPDKRIQRDQWLAPLTLDQSRMGNYPEISRSGVRASNKGFLSLTWDDYLALLKWTIDSESAARNLDVPPKLNSILERVGIKASKWQRMIKGFRQLFGHSSCVGTSESMSAFARSRGRQWAKGQAAARECFAA